MRKVTLLGDSIRLLYGPIVAKELEKDGIKVFQTEDNCRFSKYTLRMLFDYKSEIEGSDVIHWNNGLWDVANLFGDGLFTPIDEYLANMDRISDILLKITPNVVFATTTPVSDDYKYQTNEDIIRLNNAVVPLLRAKGIIINDLFEVLYPIRNQVICSDLLHLNEKGIEISSKQVLASIKSFNV